MRGVGKMNLLDDIEQAAKLVSNASRIMVLGNSGAGKTTLSKSFVPGTAAKSRVDDLYLALREASRTEICQEFSAIRA